MEDGQTEQYGSTMMKIVDKRHPGRFLDEIFAAIEYLKGWAEDDLADAELRALLDWAENK